MTFHPRANCGLGSTELHARILVEVGGWIDFYLEMSPCWGQSSSSDTQCFQFIVIHFGNKLIGWSPVDACGMVDDFCFTGIQGNVGKLGLVVFIGTGSKGGRGKGQCQKKEESFKLFHCFIYNEVSQARSLYVWNVFCFDVIASVCSLILHLSAFPVCLVCF